MRKVLQRDTSNKVIAGVCGGLGNYFGLDPVLFRAIFLLLLFIGGGGLLVYIILWIVIPYGKVEQFSSGQTFEERNESYVKADKAPASPDSANIAVGLMLISAGILLLVNNIVPGFNFKKFWPLILIIVGGGLMLGHKKLREVPENNNEMKNEESQ